MDQQLNLLPGTLDMLILKAISLSPLHGYGILLRIQQISKERLEIQQGSLYPALYRLEHHGWIASAWGSRRTSGAPAITGSPQPGNVGCNQKPNAGTR
jgi:DNA-binding PadR family transcriptional regulator